MSTYIVHCRDCGAANRIPGEKEGVPARCGSCKAELPPLYLGPQQLNDETFDRFINAYHGPVIAEFWAPW